MRYFSKLFMDFVKAIQWLTSVTQQQVNFKFFNTSDAKYWIFSSQPVNGSNCQQNDLLNRLLLRVLLSSMMTTTTQNPLMENINRLFNINPTSTSPTTVITSTAVSTVTQLFSTIVNVLETNNYASSYFTERMNGMLIIVSWTPIGDVQKQEITDNNLFQLNSSGDGDPNSNLHLLFCGTFRSFPL